MFMGSGIVNLFSMRVTLEIKRKGMKRTLMSASMWSAAKRRAQVRDGMISHIAMNANK